MKRLIVNADDFGLTSGVNRAIIEAHQAGSLTSATLMVSGRAASEAAGLSRENPDLGVGLHVNLTSGAPVLAPEKVPSLVGSDGRFPGMEKALIRLTIGMAKSQEIEAEVVAQINCCRELGVEPTHVDSHHHLHAHPRLRRVLTRVCQKAGIRKARGYRMGPRSSKAAVIRLAAALPVGARELRTPERFSGIEVMGTTNMAAALERELAATEGTLEFMVHPGYADRELALTTSYNHLRQVELKALTSGEFLRVAREAGAELISFRDL